jgi:hypothetical protein
MADDTVSNILKQIDALTVDQRVSLATQIVERLRSGEAAAPHRHKWREIRGLARPSLLGGEDAQTWVSRTRREADERRDSQLRRTA